MEEGAAPPATAGQSSAGCEQILPQAAEHRGAMGQDQSHTEELDLAQVQELCILFMKECPSGALHLHEFKRMFGVQSSSVEESVYMETIFHSFDTNKVKGSAPPKAPENTPLCPSRTTRWTSWSTWPRCT